jgi:hypothetical protein
MRKLSIGDWVKLGLAALVALFGGFVIWEAGVRVGCSIVLGSIGYAALTVQRVRPTKVGAWIYEYDWVWLIGLAILANGSTMTAVFIAWILLRDRTAKAISRMF